MTENTENTEKEENPTEATTLEEAYVEKPKLDPEMIGKSLLKECLNPQDGES